MARAPAKTITTVTETMESEATGTEIPLTDGAAKGAPTVEEDVLAELLAAGVEEDIKYVVKCISPANKVGNCTTYGRGELSPDRIREDWGAGTYTVTAQNGRGQYIRRATIKLVEPAKTANTPVSQTTMLAEMAQILRANQQTTAPPATDMTQVLLGMMNSQAQMLTAIMNRPLPSPPPAPDYLAMIAAMKDILKPEKSEGSSVSMLLKGLELGKDLGGGAGWTDVVAKGLDQVVPLLGEVVKTRQQTPAARPPMRARPIPNRPQAALPNARPNPTPAAEATETPADESEEAVDIFKKIQWLQRQVAVLLVQAAADKDPELYAEVFLDNLPEFFTLEEVHENLTKPDALEQLAKLNAGVLEHREWFEEFRQAALKQIIEDDAEDEAENEPETRPPQDAPAPAPSVRRKPNLSPELNAALDEHESARAALDDPYKQGEPPT